MPVLTTSERICLFYSTLLPNSPYSCKMGRNGEKKEAMPVGAGLSPHPHRTAAAPGTTPSDPPPGAPAHVWVRTAQGNPQQTSQLFLFGAYTRPSAKELALALPAPHGRGHPLAGSKAGPGAGPGAPRAQRPGPAAIPGARWAPWAAAPHLVPSGGHGNPTGLPAIRTPAGVFVLLWT